MALYVECRINKNILLQTVFVAIFPTGKIINETTQFKKLSSGKVIAFYFYFNNLTRKTFVRPKICK